MAAASDLPDSIIHHIQSFLTPKESAQTALLSKSWRDAWFTRPTLVLDKADFESLRYIDDPGWFRYSLTLDPLIVFAWVTFQRYKELNLSINTFKLRLSREWFGYPCLAAEWTSEALRIGATDLTLQFEDVRYKDRRDIILVSKVFESENIVKLCLKNMTIHVGVIKCSGLKSLTLSNVEIRSESFFNIISGCPLIENLSLSKIYFSEYQHGTMSCLGKLRSLVMIFLGDHRFHTLLLGDMSSKFPILKDLTLTLGVYDLQIPKEALTIASNSLEIFNLTVDNDWGYNPEKKTRRVELHLPSIRKFTCEASDNFPELYFKSTRGNLWESYLSIKQYQHHKLSDAWFGRLSKFLTKLRGSRIHLFLHERSPEISYNYHGLECLSACEVEDVTIDAGDLPTMIFNVLCDGLFRICRPKMIAQYITPPYSCGNTRNNELYQFLCGLFDLDQVKLLDEEVQRMDSTRRVRFRLKWKPCS